MMSRDSCVCGPRLMSYVPFHSYPHLSKQFELIKRKEKKRKRSLDSWVSHLTPVKLADMAFRPCVGRWEGPQSGAQKRCISIICPIRGWRVACTSPTTWWAVVSRSLLDVIGASWFKYEEPIDDHGRLDRLENKVVYGTSVSLSWLSCLELVVFVQRLDDGFLALSGGMIKAMFIKLLPLVIFPLYFLSFPHHWIEKIKAYVY